jgi:hypothetical protein
MTGRLVVRIIPMRHRDSRLIASSHAFRVFPTKIADVSQRVAA